MSKQYGLIIPGQEKPKAVSQQTTKPSVFNESSEDDSDNDAPTKMQKKSAIGPGVMERRLARQMQEKALAEDPTCFQYDELYDGMENKREEEKQIKKNEPKQAKYIGRLMETAERRKLENELRMERQVQKEREEEGETFKDKESFVTSAYRKKLEDLRKLQEEEKRDDYLEAIGDVTKQKNLDGFYRHIFELKTGSTKEVIKPEIAAAKPTTTTKDEANETAKPDDPKSNKTTQRAYRKRKSSEDNDDQATPEHAAAEKRKVHLENNIDADSDFSIDSSSSADDDSDDETAAVAKKKKSKDEKKAEEANNQSLQMDPKTIAINLNSGKNDEDKNAAKQNSDAAQEAANESKPQPKPKVDKSKIWQKRTVGEVFDAAVKRYFERKAAKCG